MKTLKTMLFIVGLACGMLLGPASASAQAASAPTTAGDDDKPWNRGVSIASRETARDLFLEGNRLFNIPLYTRAEEKYIAALSKWQHPAFHFNLALTQLNLGKDVEARDSFEQALKYGQEPLGQERFQEAQKQLQDLKRKLGRIRVSCPTPGADVALDGVTLFTGPGNYEGWLTAKAHEITAKKPDYLAQARKLTISPGQLQELDLRLVTLSEAADTGRRWAIWKPWAVVATGGVVAVSAGVLHTLSARNFSDYDKQFQQLPCATTTGCSRNAIPHTLSDQLNRATQEQQLAVGGYIAGGSVIAAGAVLLYLNRPRLLEQLSTGAAAREVFVAPMARASGFGIVVGINH
jgi:hypothetical protein